MPVLYLVRHGESAWNRAGRIQGQSARAGSLTPTGRAQADRTARELAERARYAELIVASDLSRARETAEIIGARLHLPVRLDPRLREQHLGKLQGRGFAEQIGEHTGQDAVNELWQRPARRPGGGESVIDMYWRIHRALRHHATAHRGAEVIVVTHGGPVRMATAPEPPAPDSPLPRAAVGNASITSWRLPCQAG